MLFRSYVCWDGMQTVEGTKPTKYDPEDGFFSHAYGGIGLPFRGHIIDQGSNKNGRYVRWDDGTQICTRDVTPDRTKQHTEQAFDFAKSFIASPAASASHPWGTASAYQLSCATMFLATSHDQWRIAFTNTSVAGANLPVRLTAIGRWK